MASMVIVVVMVIMLIAMVVVMVITMLIVAMVSMLITMIVVVMVVMASMILAMVVVMLIDMNLAVKVFRFTPHQGWTNGGFNREATVIAKTPLHHYAKQPIDGVVLRAAIEIGLEPSMAFDGENG